MLDSRTTLGFEVVEDIRKFFKEKVYHTIIPRRISVLLVDTVDYKASSLF